MIQSRGASLKSIGAVTGLVLGLMGAQAAQAGDPSALRSILKDCYSGASLPASQGGALKTLNRGKLSTSEATNLRWIKNCVVPFLPGTPETRALLAAQVSWWSLREGVMGFEGKKLFGYANCHENGEDTYRTKQPLYNCGTNIWQAGVAAGQVMNYSAAFYAAKTRATIAELSPQVTERQLLEWSATLAGYPAGTGTHRAIVSSKGRVKRSWLMRNPLIGYLVTAQQEVVKECYQQKKRWCFAGSFRSAKLFGNSSAAMDRTIGQLQSYFLAQ